MTSQEVAMSATRSCTEETYVGVAAGDVPAPLTPPSPAGPADHAQPLDAGTAFPYGTLIVLPWHDPLVDPTGHDPRSPYVEHFWLGILGPSATWLLRRIAAGFDHWPDGFELDLTETAAALGLASTGGRHSPFQRTLQRMIQFGMAQPASYGLAVRRRLPALSGRQLARLPEPMRESHQAWMAADGRDVRAERDRERAFALARTLLELGDGPQDACRQLDTLGVPGRVSTEAVRLACTHLGLITTA